MHIQNRCSSFTIRYELTKEQKPSETMEEVGQNNGGGNSKEADYLSVNISDRELPSHLLTCPDISLHYGEMLVPEIKTADHENSFAEALKKRYSFSMGYALAWALFFRECFLHSIISVQVGLHFNSIQLLCSSFCFKCYFTSQWH